MTDHFVIVGAQRSGTTRLYRMLQQHPDICMAEPMRPEPKFFLHENAVQAGYEAYIERHFSHRDGERLLGEKSTSYIEREDAISRLKTVLPDAHLVFVLRDPVLRAYSNWRFSRGNGLENLDFESALDAEAQRLSDARSHGVSVSPFAYTQRGLYVDYLERWSLMFSREKIIVVLSEDLFAGPDAIRKLFRRLSIPADIPLMELGRVNASQDDRHTPTAATTERLREYFAPSVQALHDQWGVDVDAWQ